GAFAHQAEGVKGAVGFCFVGPCRTPFQPTVAPSLNATAPSGDWLQAQGVRVSQGRAWRRRRLRARTPFMPKLSPEGLRAVADIAQRTGFSSDAVASMLFAVIAGNGRMAQFSHPEFGGSGQWMGGGAIMLSDMFNNALKARVDALCGELSALVMSEPRLTVSGSFQSQSQGAVPLGGGRSS